MILEFLSELKKISQPGGLLLQWQPTLLESGDLPSAGGGLRAAMVGDIIHVTGGSDADYNDFTSILAWDPVAETWNAVGDMHVARSYHAAVAVPHSIIKCT